MFTLSRLFLICSLIVFPLTSFAIDKSDIGSPEQVEPEIWQPDVVALFSDSLSDSHGDSFLKPERAYSTYNLLRTLNGDMVKDDNGSEVRPMNLSEIISKRASINNIHINLELMSREIYRESQEKDAPGRFFGELKADGLKAIGEAITGVLGWLDKLEERFDKAILWTLEQASGKVDSWMRKVKKNGIAWTALRSLKKQIYFLTGIIEQDLEDLLLDFSENQLLEITGQLKDMIPLVPDPEYYITGKWTAGVELDKVWAEYVIRMMSTTEKQVKLDNRAMAGSWTLCASSKVEHMETLKKTAAGLKEGFVMLFQGSLIPPCEGLIVRSYLNQKREIFKKDHQRKPKLKDDLIPDNTLVVFFNGANDFLNMWADPDDVSQEHINDIFNILLSGARRVVVVLLPDIGRTPRFNGTDEGRQVTSLITKYNDSMEQRLQLLRARFNGEGGYQVTTIHADRIFDVLLAQEHWDTVNPLLDVEVPGVDKKEEVRKEAEATRNFVVQELVDNHAFDDNWKLKGRSRQEATSKKVVDKKVAFFADSVHPSAEAHYAIAKMACEMMSEKGLYCDPANYPLSKAREDSRYHDPTLGAAIKPERDEL
ncbi:SGNH/GDSL hydrolase family protein [Endozoicomonas arenosclerae]|uniref:SGNH/GDSL hydrolase family protein n=1 Tax=Endozoicomonas arenosclerae TaxID=1633495 RepID=UPI000783F993|nr:SGNH/GDSL hydrolase family protein [Endozoicomonas arenosclerae]